jgi:integration host factor subunit beta
MVKSELIKNIADKIPALTDKDVELAVTQIVNSVTEALCRGEHVEIRGFGSFALHYHPARKAHNPKTGEKVITAPKYSPHFKAGKELRERINAARNVPIKKA